jgi:hypothetical protein
VTDDLDAWLAEGSRPEATVNICLVGDLAARYQTKAEELLTAASDPNRSLEAPGLDTLAAEVEALKQEMDRHTRTITLQALPVDAEDGLPSYLDLQVAHPPRDADEIDQRVGYNRQTFLPALVKACTTDPVMTDAQWSTFLGKLSSRQWDELWVTAQQLNRQDYQSPKSLGISEQMPASAVKSKPRARSGSRSSGSAAGSRKRATPTTTPDA